MKRTCELNNTTSGVGQVPKVGQNLKFKMDGALKLKGAKNKTKQKREGGGTPNKSDIRKYMVKREVNKIELFEAKSPHKKGILGEVAKTCVQSNTDMGGEAWTGSPRGH